MRNSTPIKLIAIILASGEGRRFGQPKSEARVQGELFSARIMRTLEEAGLRQMILAQGLATSSMLETLRQAMASCVPRADSYLIFPVDHPFVRAQSIRALTLAALPDTIIKPVFEGRSGHPIIIPASLDLTGDDAGGGLKGIIRNCALPCVYITVPDAGILRNINTVQDLRPSHKHP